MSLLIELIKNKSKKIKTKFRFRWFIMGALWCWPIVIIINILFLYRVMTVEQKNKFDLDKKNTELKSEINNKDKEIIKLQNNLSSEIEKQAISVKEKIRYFNTEDCILEERLSESDLDEMAKAVIKYSQKYNWDKDWILAMIWIESAGRTYTWDPKKKIRKFYMSNKGAIGPAQFLPSTAVQVCRILGLKFPKDKYKQQEFLSKSDNAIYLMCAFMQQLFYKKSLKKATTEYWGGIYTNGYEYFMTVAEKYYQLKNMR